MEPEETERLDCSFSYADSTALSLDPKEFRGQGKAQVTETILKTLRDLNPGVSYFKDEVELTADLIVGINESNGQG